MRNSMRFEKYFPPQQVIFRLKIIFLDDLPFFSFNPFWRKKKKLPAFIQNKKKRQQGKLYSKCLTFHETGEKLLHAGEIF